VSGNKPKQSFAKGWAIVRTINLEAVAEVNRALLALGVDFALTGGVVVSFLLDYPALFDVRPTDDIDAIAAVINLREYSRLEEKLRGAGFRNDTSDGAPPCRFLYQGIKVDVMPAEDETGRFSDRWFRHALATASDRTLRGVKVKTVSASSFIALKLAAFEDRGRGDYYSHDIEDIITVIDGRESLVAELSAEDAVLRRYVGEKIGSMMSDRRFVDALPGHLGATIAQQQRLPRLIERLNAIATPS